MSITTFIKKAREKCEKATQGPWTAISYDGDICGPYNRVHESLGPTEVYADRKINIPFEQEHDNSVFIAASRTLLPKALDALERAVKELSAMQVASRPDRMEFCSIWASEALADIERILGDGK